METNCSFSVHRPPQNQVLNQRNTQEVESTLKEIQEFGSQNQSEIGGAAVDNNMKIKSNIFSQETAWLCIITNFSFFLPFLEKKLSFVLYGVKDFEKDDNVNSYLQEVVLEDFFFIFTNPDVQLILGVYVTVKMDFLLL